MKNSLEQENNFLKEMIRTYYQPEIDNLQQRIDKAIEYINHYTDNEYRNGRDDELYLELNNKQLDILLEILRGEDE